MNQKHLLFGLLVIGTALIGICTYWLLKPPIQIIQTPSNITSETIAPKIVRNKSLEVLKPTLKINSDSSWTVIVPASEENGVSLETTDGRKFQAQAGDRLIIEASGAGLK